MKLSDRLAAVEDGGQAQGPGAGSRSRPAGGGREGAAAGSSATSAGSHGAGSGSAAAHSRTVSSVPAGKPGRRDRADASGTTGGGGAAGGGTGRVASQPARGRTIPPASQLSSWDESKRVVRDLVLSEVAPKVAKLTGDDLSREVRSALDRILTGEAVRVSPNQRRRFVEEVIQDTLGYGPLEPLLAEPGISEIMCNAYNDIWVEREGRIERSDVSFASDAQYRQVIDRIVTTVGRRVDEGSPMVDARLPDGSRVNAIIPPIAIHGPALTIRRFPSDAIGIKELIAFGSITADMALLMEACVRGRLNILVSGGTGTGKTTTLNAFSSFIPDGERVVTIEDSAELQLQQPHVINLEARPPNAEGVGEVRIRELVKNSLRMRPDRIIVGEVRGAEALDMLQAMNTGHEGSLTTVHANSARDAMSRLETMVLMAGFELPVRAIREQIASAFDLIVHLTRLPTGQRVISSVTELQGMEGDVILLQDVFLYHYDQGTGGHLSATGLRPRMVDQLRDRGVEVPARLFRPTPKVDSGPAQARGPAGNGERPRGSLRRLRVPTPRELAEPDRSR